MVRAEESAVQTIEPIPPALLRAPLEFLFAEHYRHRQLCRALEQLAAETSFLQLPMKSVADFIGKDLALHVKDEEEDFFPMLRRRCDPDDNIGSVLDRLSNEHALDEELATVARAVLRRCIATSTAVPRSGEAIALTRLADQERRHLALENAVVMPIARTRLTAKDLAQLSEQFAKRRGVVLV